MNQEKTLELLRQIKRGELSPEDAISQLKLSPFEDLGYAKVDHHRGVRQGIPEIIYGSGKTPEQIVGIVRSMRANGDRNIMITRLFAPAKEELLIAAEKDGLDLELTYYDTARIGVSGRTPEVTGNGSIIVATGGTSDLPIAEEAAVTAETLGNQVNRLYDVGVAGLHRLLAHTEEIMNARVIIAVAGMEGALASVVGGLADCPVIAVPTSVGYGANFGGLSALLSMLNSCASGVSVVNIDNGFGAGYLASMINHIKTEGERIK